MLNVKFDIQRKSFNKYWLQWHWGFQLCFCNVNLYSFDTLYLHTSPKVCRETKDVTFSQEQCSNENTKGFHTFRDEKNNPLQSFTNGWQNSKLFLVTNNSCSLSPKYILNSERKISEYQHPHAKAAHLYATHESKMWDIFAINELMWFSL